VQYCLEVETFQSSAILFTDVSELPVLGMEHDQDCVIYSVHLPEGTCTIASLMDGKHERAHSRVTGLREQGGKCWLLGLCG